MFIIGKKNFKWKYRITSETKITDNLYIQTIKIMKSKIKESTCGIYDSF